VASAVSTVFCAVWRDVRVASKESCLFLPAPRCSAAFLCLAICCRR
jgi:hypothetical protein